MHSGLIYRRATAADADMLCAMMADQAVFGGLLQLPYPSAEVWRKRIEDTNAQPGNLNLLAVDTHGATAAVVGSAGIHGHGHSMRTRHVAGLGISVAKQWQRRGIGSELMRRLLDFADNWVGYLRLELQVYTDNEAGMSLYRKFGFAQEGTLRANALREGRFVDSHLMARLHPQPPQLTPAASTAP
jgi:putative acetyltransferase